MIRRVNSIVRAFAVALVAASCGACALLPEHSDDPARVVRGPFPSRTQEPIALTFLQFTPRSLATARPGKPELRATSAYSSLYENGFSNTASVVIDAELWRNAFSLRTGVTPNADVEIEVPVVYAANGFLDRFIESFHNFFLFPAGGRDDRPLNTYAVDVEQNGRQAYRLEDNRLGLGDIPIVFTQKLVEESESSPALGWRAGVELPTGSESRGFGNGRLDAGAGVLAERSWGRVSATGAIDWVKTARSKSFERAGIDAHDDLDLQLGLEYRWNDDLSLLGGLVLTSPVTRDIALKEIDREILSVDFGFARDLGSGSRLYFTFEEDAIADSGPDFTVYVGWELVL